MSETGINETPYPEVEGDVIVTWSPGFEGEPGRDNEFSADALLYGGDIILPSVGKEDPSVGLVIALAMREEGEEPAVPQTPITVGIELNRADLVALSQWAYRTIDEMDGPPVPPFEDTYPAGTDLATYLADEGTTLGEFIAGEQTPTTLGEALGIDEGPAFYQQPEDPQ